MGFFRKRSNRYGGQNAGEQQSAADQYNADWEQLQQYAAYSPFDQAQAWENRQAYQQEYLDNSPEGMMRRAVIDGDPYTVEGQDYILTPEVLWQAGLEPRYEITVDGRHIGISHLFEARGRKAAIAYVEDDYGGIHVRSYYQSNSSGFWRYLPDYVADKTGRPTWFGKAYSEECTTLPFELQQGLNEINGYGVTDTNGVDPEYFLFGTARKYPSKDVYADHLHDGTLNGDFYREVASVPTYSFGELSTYKRQPEYVDITDHSAPNFWTPPMLTRIHSQMYGETDVEIFPSLDGELRYSMCKVGYPPRAWVGNIETAAPITSTGCRAGWVSMGDVGTPLYEHKGAN